MDHAETGVLSSVRFSETRPSSQFAAMRRNMDNAETGLVQSTRARRMHPYERANQEEVPTEEVPADDPDQDNGANNMDTSDDIEHIDLTEALELPTELCQHWTNTDGHIHLTAGEVSTRHLKPDERAAFIEAKVKELESFFENGVWEHASTSTTDDARTMRARFLLKWSKNADGTPRAKARLVVQGFRDPDALSGNLETSSPTATRHARIMILNVARIMEWIMFTADITTAFLQGKKCDRNLYVALPAEACRLLGYPEGTRMKLVKSMYGLSDAPRNWWKEATDRLLACGFIPHPLDPCLFLSYTEGANRRELDGALCLHVDDILGAGDTRANTGACFKKRLQKLKESFSFRTWEDGEEMSFCGAKLRKRACGDIEMSMQEYLHKLTPITLTKDRLKDPSQPVTAAEHRQLRGLLGGMAWPSTQTCPHAQCTVSLLQGISAPTVNTIIEANKHLRFLKANADVGICARKVVDRLSDLRFAVLTDAAWGVRTDGTSQGGYMVIASSDKLLRQQNCAYNVIDWRS